MADIPLAQGMRLPHVEIEITQAMIDRYAAISGDFNPVHVDPDRAAASPFGSTIAHGCIPMEPLFQALARAMGRPLLPFGTRVSLRYRAPARPGDRIRVEGAVADRKDDAWQVPFACLNQSGQTVIDGTCLVPATDGQGAGPA
ncbi:MaoC family dehydratase [Aquibium sp. LZ166]|uniref:MaoC family dehydratase n=1 Tax=Aquibium pacificus TaxID=3153579 RepID=A0ABV3SGN9_9HYPH